jgi:diacylglycerol kinase family enzyme
VYADGDPIAELPVTVGVLPGAVQTLVPTTMTASPATVA